MRSRTVWQSIIPSLFVTLAASSAIVTVAAEVQIKRGVASSPFQSTDGLFPLEDDVASKATLRLISGREDRNSGGLSKLVDGKLPASEDEPASNFFFVAGSSGGRIRMDLGRNVDLAAINSYSWHPDVRGPQVYDLYVMTDGAENADLNPNASIDPSTCGWSRIATIDTRKATDGGELSSATYAVGVKAGEDELKAIRYLLFDIHATDDKNAFAQTFFSEIDVLERGVTTQKRIPLAAPQVFEFATADGQFRFEMNFQDAPDLSQWSRDVLSPVVMDWYPKIVAQLPSDDYAAPRFVRLRYRTDMNGTPAYAMGNTISLNAQWYRTQLNNEARGAAVHELVHVAQQYGRRDLQKANARSTPGWVVEGIADYIRWFQYEPESKGAVITGRRVESAKYDASYRITGNFLDWVIRNKDAELLKHLNAAARTGQYDSSLWKDRTGLELSELESEWKTALRAGNP